MMKRRNTLMVVLPLLASLCVGNMHAHRNNSGFIAGACAIGGAILAAAGIAAIIDSCTAETDNQLIARIDRECRSIDARYNQTMSYFGPRAGVGIHPPHRPIDSISESVLYEFATYVWNSNTSQADYRAGVWSAKRTLESNVQDLRKRIRSFEDKTCKHEDLTTLRTMRKLLHNAELLLADIALFADCLETHKTYCTLYDSVGKMQNRYAHEISIITSGRYTFVGELKQSIMSRDSGMYPLRSFVKSIESDISTLQSNVYALVYSYDSGRAYANSILRSLTDIRNSIVSDPRYQQELYAYEQARLERQRIEAMEAHARLERERVRLERERNAILQQRNYIEMERVNQQRANQGVTHVVSFNEPQRIEEFSVSVTF